MNEGSLARRISKDKWKKKKLKNKLKNKVDMKEFGK